jgi:cell division protein FtsB
MYRGQSSISLYLSLKDSEVVLGKEVEDLKSENARLSDELMKLTTSKDYARKVLRDRYHVTDTDEKIIYFAD